MAKYYTRIADAVLSEFLQLRGAVLIEGIKWCGKTTTAKQKSLSVLDLSVKKEKEKAELLSSLEPVVATLTSFLFLHTVFMPMDLAGFAAVLLGCILLSAR